MEAIDFGSKLFLIDEDKSATNFMIRDSRMKQLVKKEPITPFTDGVQQLFSETGITTILVIVGSGEYLEVADNVILMDEFKAYNFTSEAKAICNGSIESYIEDNLHSVNWYHNRKIMCKGFTPYPKEQGTEQLDVVGRETILIGNEKLDVRMLHGIISHPQLNALAYMLRFMEVKASEEIINIEEAV